MKDGEFKIGPNSKEELKKDMNDLIMQTFFIWAPILLIIIIVFLKFKIFASTDSYQQWWESNKEDKSRSLGIIETDKCNASYSINKLKACTKEIEKIRLRYQIICINKKSINDRHHLSNKVLTWNYENQRGKVRTDLFL
ncbi:hypothetical protein [Bacteriovorax sp. BAL6_X]|uniref:hypothetical protein n=1 Tax=Bacteriovorax sp. BAL6_X TaxID=1201290 RepID=UPI00058FA4D5|nr:hypothetical protein [Bacteriovorax sp. BAL6_X]